MRRHPETWRAAALSALPLFAVLTACIVIPPDPPPPVELPPAAPPPQEQSGASWGYRVTRHTAVLWLIRVDRGTSNLAAGYEKMIEQMTGALARAGFALDTLVVASLYDGRALWASGKDLGPPPATLAEALRYYAARASPTPVNTCTTCQLTRIARDITLLQVVYPADLGSSSRSSPQFPFRSAPDVFLVGIVDSAGRPREPADPACAAFGSSVSSWLGAYDPVVWLRYPDQLPLRRVETHFAFVATPEQVPFDEMRVGCLKVPGFPRQALDEIEPSTVRFFEPLTAQLDARAGPLARRFDLCEAVGGQWPVDGFADDWAQQLGPAEDSP